MQWLSYWSMLFAETQICVQQANIIHLATLLWFLLLIIGAKQSPPPPVATPSSSTSISTTIAIWLLFSLWLSPPLSHITVSSLPSSLCWLLYYAVILLMASMLQSNGRSSSPWAYWRHSPQVFIFFSWYLIFLEISLWFLCWILLL